MKLELIAATTFGLEAVVRREIEALGYKIIKTEDGRVIFEGSERAIVRANLWLRSADRVQIKMAEFKALEVRCPPSRRWGKGLSSTGSENCIP